MIKGILISNSFDFDLYSRSRGGEPDGCITAASPKPPGVNNNNRRPSIQTGAADRLSQVNT